jgi:nitroreductase
MMESILELARWAPSGDNSQPWRFLILSADRFRVLGHDTRTHCVYDLDGHASQLAIGCLLETLEIAASKYGVALSFEHIANTDETRPCFDVRLHLGDRHDPDPLLPYITARTVQRSLLSPRALTSAEKIELQAALPAGFHLVWIEGWPRKWRMAKLLSANAKIRLTIPEAYATHRSIIEWGARYSETKVPDQAIGLDPLTLRLMRWAMQSWRRVALLNRYLAGTLIPRLELDILPALACAAHFGLLATRPPTELNDYVAAGRAVQRLWLTATRLGLQLQPEMTPVIFARYVREGRRFTVSPTAAKEATNIARLLANQLGRTQLEHLVFLGRIGAGRSAHARSLRRPLADLCLSDNTG